MTVASVLPLTAAPPTSVWAARAYIIALVREAESGQCRPLPDKVVNKNIGVTDMNT